MKTAIFRTAVMAGILFFAGTATAQQNNIPTQNGAWEHCGCDTEKGIEKFVGSLVDEAKHRDAVCESANTHIPLCITVWCSMCAGHENAVKNCLKTADSHLADATESCTKQPANPFTVAEKIPNFPL